MAFGQTIEVTVSPKGEVSSEAKGYSDNTCLQATAGLEKALGKVTKRIAKDEMLKQPVVAEKVKIGR